MEEAVDPPELLGRFKHARRAPPQCHLAVPPALHVGRVVPADPFSPGLRVAVEIESLWTSSPEVDGVRVENGARPAPPVCWALPAMVG